MHFDAPRMMYPGSSSNGASSQFYSIGRGSNSDTMAVVTDSLGHISNQISSMQQCLTALTNTVDGLSTKTMELTNRVAALEDIAIESQPVKKKKIDIPRDLSVSFIQL